MPEARNNENFYINTEQPKTELQDEKMILCPKL